MGKGVGGGGLWFGVGGFWGLQPQCLIYGAAKEGTCRSPAGWGLLGSLRGATPASPARTVAKGPTALGCQLGQLGAVRTKHSQFDPCPPFPSIHLGIPFPGTSWHKRDHSWSLTDPSSAPTAHQNPLPPASVSGFFSVFALKPKQTGCWKPERQSSAPTAASGPAPTHTPSLGRWLSPRDAGQR